MKRIGKPSGWPAIRYAVVQAGNSAARRRHGAPGVVRARAFLVLTHALVALVLSLGLPLVLSAQQQTVTFEHITVADGLPENSVYAMLQDHIGFLWLGTLNGLVKYDGLTMTTYRPDAEDPYSISGRSIRALHEGPTGDLWIGTWNHGLNHFDLTTERFTRYVHVPSDPHSLSHDFVRFIHEDRHGDVWVITDQWHLDKLNRETGTFTRYRHDPNDPASLSEDWMARTYVAGVSTLPFLEDRNGTIWIGTMRAGLNRYDRATDTFTRYLSPAYRKDLPLSFEAMDRQDREQRSLAALLEVGNAQHRTQSFSVAAETPILIVAMGEYAQGAFKDEGWIENERGEVVWAMAPEDTYHAGGTADNAVQIASDTLAAGAYRLHYQSDGRHAYASWEGAPPDRPERWGIQVYALAGKDASVAFDDRGAIEPDAMPADHVFALLEDASGTLWIGTDAGLSSLDRSTGVFTTYGRDHEGWLVGSVYAIYEDQAGRLWVGSRRGGLSRFDRQTGVFTAYGSDPDDLERLSSNDLLPVQEDEEGALWLVSGTGGLDRFDPATAGVTRMRYEPNTLGSLSPQLIRSVVSDRSGILWVGTGTGGGLSKWDPYRHQFSPFGLDHDDPGLRNSPSVSAIYGDRQGTLWLGTPDRGLGRVDLATGSYTRYEHREEDPKSLSHNAVTALVPDRQGTLWIGTGGGLNKMVLSTTERSDRDPATFVAYRHDPDDPNSLIDDRIVTIHQDHQGTLWIGTMGGLCRFDPATDSFASYARDPADAKYNRVTTVLEDRDGLLWVGLDGEGGLNTVDREARTFSRYPAAATADRTITALYEDHAGRLWVGTLLDGLHVVDRKTGTTTRYTTLEGLPNDTVMGILEDEQGHLWISTRLGLARLDPATQMFRTYDKNDGLSSDAFFQGAAYRSDRGTLFFGGRGGIDAFIPHQITENPRSFRVVLTDLTVFDRAVLIGEGRPLKQHISVAEDVTLKHDQNDFTIDYVGLQFSHPARTTYRYRLDGYEAAWREVGTQRRAIYSNLSPGAYTFRVEAAPADGVWREEDASIRVTIRLPWWRTGWAYGLFGLLFIVGVYAVDRVRRRQVLAKERMRAALGAADLRASSSEERAVGLVRLDEIKSRFFANFSHELRTPLTLIAGPLQRLQAGVFGALSPAVTAQHDMMLRNTQRLLRLVNQILDLIRLEARSLDLHLRRQDLVAFTRSTVEMFASLAEYRDIALSYHSALPVCRVPFDGAQMEKVLANLLSNALKFTRAGGQVSVTVTADADGAEIAVEDTGIGMALEQVEHVFDRFYQAGDGAMPVHEGTGIGLALVQELVALHGGTVRCTSEVGQGSRFIVRLPWEAVAPSEAAPPIVPRSALPILPAFLERPEETGNGDKPEGEADVTTVLVVEDNPDMRAYVRSILAGRYRVLEAEDGARGLDLAREALPDLILSDVMMPQMDGFALSRALKADPVTACIPVILLTARAAPEDTLQGIETGADAYVAKPFVPEVLLARVHNLIALRHRLRERYAQTPEPEAEVALRSAFEHQVRQVIAAHLSDPGLTVTQVADALALSPYQLGRRLGEEVALKPKALIRAMRLERAASLLAERAGTVSEVAYAVGFNSRSYFSRCFYEHFGVNPSAYGEAKQNVAKAGLQDPE